jgi:Holliday junction resolvasome RuvABC endonuclease subunit
VKKELSLRVVSIDPGFNNLGVSFSNLNYHSGLMVVNDVNTYQIQKLTSRVDGSIIQDATNGLINVETVKALIGRLLDTYKPDVVVCESSYMGKFPQAFVSLSLCLHAIECDLPKPKTDNDSLTLDMM